MLFADNSGELDLIPTVEHRLHVFVFRFEFVKVEHVRLHVVEPGRVGLSWVALLAADADGLTTKILIQVKCNSAVIDNRKRR